MKKLISTAKSTYLLTEHPVNMHVETTDWLSDIEFCKTELAFLAKLQNRVFLNANNKRKINQATALDKKIKLFREKTLLKIHDSIIKHENHLASLDENAFTQDRHVIAEEHKKHKLSVNAFMGSVKKIKKEVFDFIEMQMVQSKKAIKEFEEGSITL